MRSSKTAASTVNLDGIDDILDGIFKKEKDSQKSTILTQLKNNLNKSSPDIKAQPASRSKISAMSTGDNKIVYFENYGKKYRALVAPIASLPEKPGEQYDGKFRGNLPSWVMGVFLCKNARKDVDRSIAMGGKNPADFVTPATEQSQKRFGGDPQEMRQGFVYCVQLYAAKHAAYIGFFKRGEDDNVECRELFDGFKIRDEITGDKVTCKSCKWVKELKVTPSFICDKNVFLTMKDMNVIEEKITCKTHVPRKEEEARGSNQD